MGDPLIERSGLLGYKQRAELFFFLRGYLTLEFLVPFFFKVCLVSAFPNINYFFFPAHPEDLKHGQVSRVR